MIEVIGVKFKEGCKIYYFNPCGLTFEAGQYAIVETSGGFEYGEVIQANKLVHDSEIVPPLKRVERAATEEDTKFFLENAEKEKEALTICEEKILKHKMDMKLIRAEYSFDRSKLLFYFTSDGRVDFRELVKDLASVFRTRIELRQIGVRDETKLLGGLGICGRPLCCKQFLSDFQPVSIKMAKEQCLSLNPTKISGSCGRLMCCLKYEQEAYDDVIKRYPPPGSVVSTPLGKGTVIKGCMLKEKVTVKLSAESDTHEYSLDEIKILKKQTRRPKNEIPDDV